MNELDQLASNNNESDRGEGGLYVGLKKILIKYSRGMGEHYMPKDTNKK